MREKKLLEITIHVKPERSTYLATRLYSRKGIARVVSLQTTRTCKHHQPTQISSHKHKIVLKKTCTSKLMNRNLCYHNRSLTIIANNHISRIILLTSLTLVITNPLHYFVESKLVLPW